MGKKLKVQRRGRGTAVFRAKKTGKIAPIKYPDRGTGSINGVVRDLLHEPGRGAPLAYIELGSGLGYYVAAPEGIYIDQSVSIGQDAPIQIGNVLPVGSIPEGTMVCNVELKPGDGGRMARSSGSFATVVSHIGNQTVLKLPSRRNIDISSDCRATIGIVAGGGRKEKPFTKAGERQHIMKAKGHIYPIAKGVKMTAASHPHGGGRKRRPGKSTTVGKNAPPGAKVGLIGARSSGRKKRRRGV